MILRPALLTDIPVISRLAGDIWWHTYKSILSDEQISFMLENMYAEDALEKQIASGIEFFIAEFDSIPAGFAGCSLTGPENTVLKLHKIYILPSEQGKGNGRKMMEQVSSLAKSKGATVVELNVNRNNPAFGFYKKLGFEVYDVVDIPYYQFTMNDYVMRKTL